MSRLTKQGGQKLRKQHEPDPAAVRTQEPPTAAPAVNFQPPVPQAAELVVPTPYEDDGGSPTLSSTERQHLQVCEAAIDALRTAFWAAGKALQTVRDARLYRETHKTFEEYVAERWDMSRPQAYRLIDAWPLAEALSPMGDTNERQVRELLPVADQHGQDAALTVYRTIVKADVRVTAAVIKGAVSVLPAEFDTEKAVEQICAYLAGELKPPAAPATDPGEQLQQVRARIRRLVSPKLIRSVPAPARKELAAELYALAKELEGEGE